MRLHWFLLILASCIVKTSVPDVPVSIDGSVQHFAVDDVVLPTTQALVMSLGSDLNGDGLVDNAVGVLLEGLVGEDDIRDDASIRALIGSGMMSSEVAVTASEESDDVVGLQYVGTVGNVPTVLRGSPANGGFASNGLEAGPTDVILPALVDADPTPVYLGYTQIEMTPDATARGFDIRVQGLADPSALATAVCDEFLQMIATNPTAHSALASVLDTNMDGTVTYDECIPTVAGSLAPDVNGPDGGSYISIGFGVHVAPAGN